MSIVFWNTRRIFSIDYLEKRKTIAHGDYYVNLLQQLSDEIKKKWPHLAEVLFHHDSALAHTPLAVMAKISEFYN